MALRLNMENLAELFIPTTLQFELYKWVKREKGEVEALEVAGGRYFSKKGKAG